LKHEVRHKARLGNAHEAAEMLERVAKALVNDLDAHHYEQKHENRDCGHESRQQHMSSPISLFVGMMRR